MQRFFPARVSFGAPQSSAALFGRVEGEVTIAAPAKLPLFGDRPKVVRIRRLVLTTAILLPVSAAVLILLANVTAEIHRSRQKRTMAGLRDWSVALEQAHHPGALSFSGTTAEIKIRSAKALPSTDGWGHPYRITIAPGIATITSAGRDGVFESRPAGGAITNFSQDLIFSNGTFFQYPEGI